MNTALIVAAGSGKRFASDRPKQFLKILDRPVVVHALEAFARCNAIDEIVLVLADGEIRAFDGGRPELGIDKLRDVVAGGRTRTASVRAGFAAADPSTEIVVVHDGARPIVTADEISMTVAAAVEVGAACLATSVTDTIKIVKNGRIMGTIDRSNLYRALTPQAFRYDILRRALEAVVDDATDECALVEALGQPIQIVEGSTRNVKITHTDDLRVAEALLRVK